VGEGHVHTVGKGLGARFDGQVVCTTGLCVCTFGCSTFLFIYVAQEEDQKTTLARSENTVGMCATNERKRNKEDKSRTVYCNEIPG
jgi:hypothetical protein